jgi:hypothetical protein
MIIVFNAESVTDIATSLYRFQNRSNVTIDYTDQFLRFTETYESRALPHATDLKNIPVGSF